MPAQALRKTHNCLRNYTTEALQFDQEIDSLVTRGPTSEVRGLRSEVRGPMSEA